MQTKCSALLLLLQYLDNIQKHLSGNHSCSQKQQWEANAVSRLHDIAPFQFDQLLPHVKQHPLVSSHQMLSFCLAWCCQSGFSGSDSWQFTSLAWQLLCPYRICILLQENQRNSPHMGLVLEMLIQRFVSTAYCGRHHAQIVQAVTEDISAISAITFVGYILGNI